MQLKANGNRTKLGKASSEKPLEVVKQERLHLRKIYL